MTSMAAAAKAKRAMKKQRSEALSKRKVEFHAAPKPKRKTVPDDMQDDPIIDDAQMLDAAPEITRRTTRVTGQSRVRDFFTVRSFDDVLFYKRVRKTPLAPPRPVDARSSYGHGFWDEEFLVEQLLAMIRKPCADPDCHSRVQTAWLTFCPKVSTAGIG